MVPAGFVELVEMLGLLHTPSESLEVPPTILERKKPPVAERRSSVGSSTPLS